MKRVIKNILFIIIGVSALYLFIDHIAKFTPHDYFYDANHGIEYYVGVNVVSRWADLSFFTYHTIILFGVWFILYGISGLFKLEKLNFFLINKNLITFIFTNYLITTFMYTFFELTSGNITFGLYANTPKAIHNFGTNILGHYIFFIIILIAFIKIEPVGVYKKKTLIFISFYVFIYYLYVLITGKFMYKIEWYPYPIFDTYALFGTRLKIYYEIPILLVIAVILSVGYYYLLKLILFLKDKRIQKIKRS